MLSRHSHAKVSCMGLSSSFVLAFAVTVVLTLTLRPLALRLHLTDKPGGRKHHSGEIPLVGGIAMFIGIIVAATATVQTTGRWALLVPAALLVIAGAIDDRYNVGASAPLGARLSFHSRIRVGHPDRHQCL